MPLSDNVIKRKKSKRKSKKTTTTTRGGIKLINNIHINSKSGTRSKRQRRGGVGGSVVPSGASTISHVPLVMNVPAPDSTQRETQYLHAIKNVQDDLLALKQASSQLALENQPSAPDPNDTLRFQQHPSLANSEDVESEPKKKKEQNLHQHHVDEEPHQDHLLYHLLYHHHLKNNLTQHKELE